MERTLSIIKPDAVKKGVAGKIIDRFEQEGLKIVAMRMIQMNEEKAKGFYAVHKERPFFPDLIKFMTMGPVVVMVLEGTNAIQKNREIMGATDPKKAEAGTLRIQFGTDIEKNAVHGSDAPETAQFEVNYFFSASDFVLRK